MSAEYTNPPFCLFALPRATVTNKSGGCTAVVYLQLLSSITPHKPELAVNHLAPLFLVTHNPDSAGGGHLGTASSNSLAAVLGNVVSAIKG